ncbi:MAG: multicopper oxidase domain-containing protein [Kofleriaceae bacterium]
MSVTRRTLLQSGLAASAALVGGRAAQASPPRVTADADASGAAPGAAPVAASRPAASGPGSVLVPNGATLPYQLRAGVKVFHLVAEPIRHEISPGLEIETWGYNGRTPGPLIEVTQGDRCRFYVTNKLPEPTTVHWHGVIVPSGMDGVAGLSQPAIPAGKTFRYEYTFLKAGTFLYHPHFDEMTQIAFGMVGMIVVHPKGPRSRGRRVRDYALLSHEWKIPIGARRPDPMAMSDFNVLTFNSKAFPATEPLVAEVGDLVRIRLGNLGPMDHHSIHLHGAPFEVVETDGGVVPRSARFPETTVMLPVGAVRVLELVAEHPGDWALHCHMTHHSMNQMGHDVVNLTGANIDGLDAKIRRAVPGYMTMGHQGMGEMMAMEQPKNSISMRGGRGPHGPIDMGGMFTILKIRERLGPGAAEGYYQAPPETVAREASAAELASDGITG